MSVGPEPKRISLDSVPHALAKAERYRLLNEPQEAESICTDILTVDPQNSEAIVMLLLAKTDQFPAGGLESAQALLPRLTDPYAKAYYAGVINERWGKGQHRPEGGYSHAQSWIREAMAFYQKAEALSPAGISDAILRWNACCRFLQTLQPDVEDDREHPGDVTPHR